MSSFTETFLAYYHSSIQLSRFQAATIGTAIRSRAPGCRLLVFGLGHDSELWLALNRNGQTRFLESSPSWIETMRLRLPGAQIDVMPTFDLTVAKSLDASLDALEAYPPPTELAAGAWDVILVDGPPGYQPNDPGRAIAIFWASRLADRGTHVFVDDYERAVEERFANAFLKNRRETASCVVPAGETTSYRQLFWSMGDPVKVDPPRRPVVLTVASADYARTWRFCIDSQANYCRRCDYDHRVIDGSDSNFHPKWAKLDYAARLLKRGIDVFLIDADAEVTHHCPPFTDIFAERPDHDIFCANGISGRPNSGVMLLRSRGAAAQFLEDCLAHRQEPVPPEDFVTSEGENGHVIWLLKRQPHFDARAELALAWNCSNPDHAEQAFVRHYTNYLRDWLLQRNGS